MHARMMTVAEPTAPQDRAIVMTFFRHLYHSLEELGHTAAVLTSKRPLIESCPGRRGGGVMALFNAWSRRDCEAVVRSPPASGSLTAHAAGRKTVPARAKWARVAS